ncbi:306_t:CDS:2 [Funneliformis caledonium]|uniref:306_t:CDS:1 n=1 Tax=Funneliformis caledonium TaxID=1117310 RepID=A0A9N9BG51_9GLOM|nr:306_t:CDS:2 [Funneliformis caledonium]
MSPGHNFSENSSISTSPIMNSYIVHVGEQTFRLYRSSITFDSPNFFTQTFLSDETPGENDAGVSTTNATLTAESSTRKDKTSITTLDNVGKTGDSCVGEIDFNKTKSSASTQTYISPNACVKEITIDRDPRSFEVILRYLRGYTIFPLSSVNLPPGMSLDLFRESLLEDARFYGLCRLARLLQAETPTPLSYKDPFTSADKILLSLRDVPIHKEFIKSNFEGSSTIEFFTGAVLTLELESSDASIRFHTKFLNEQDQKALETLGDICGENSKIQFSRHLSTNRNMREALNGIRLEIDGVQVTGVDIASLVGSYSPKAKALEDMFRQSGGQKLVIYAQEFVFRLDHQTHLSNNFNKDDDNKDNVKDIDSSDIIYINSNGAFQDDESKNESDHTNHFEDSSRETIKANRWTQEWWAWNEYRMKLDTLQ